MKPDDLLSHHFRTPIDEMALDDAISRGLNRAKRERFDPRQLIKLAAGFLITLAVCASLIMSPLHTVATQLLISHIPISETMGSLIDTYLPTLPQQLTQLLGGS